MKKTNLFKKMTSLFLAIMMLMSVVPMMASAEVSDGKFWLTLGMTTFDDYVEVSRSAGTYVAKKSDNSGWLYQTAGNNKYKDVFASTNSSMRLHHGTGVRAFADTDFYEAAPVIEGAGELTIYGRLNRGWSNSSPSWYAGDGKGSPDSIIMVSDLFDKADVKVGDTVKITAWVNSVYPQSATSSADNIEGGAGEVPADATATVSMWVADKATDGTVGTAAADYHLTPVTDASWTDAVTHKNLTYGQWQALSLTYTVTDANKGASGIALNSDLLGTTEKVTSFPLELHIAAVKAEKLIKNEGEYTIEDGKKWKATPDKTINIDSFNASDNPTAEFYDHAYNATIDGEDYTLSINNGSGCALNTNNKIFTLEGEGIASGAPAIVGATAVKLHSHYVANPGPYPDANYSLSNIFDPTKVSVGDKIKVTAYVYPNDLYAFKENADGAELTAAGIARMRLMIGDHEQYVDGKIKQWNEFSIIHEITAENINDNSVRIDCGSATVGVMYGRWFLGAVSVTTQEEDSAEVAGRITGTVAAAPATVETGADYRVLVGAYKKVGDVYMMLGCNILPYEADCSYDFVINDAEGATDVFAYLWDFNAYEPQIVPIECTYIAQ